MRSAILPLIVLAATLGTARAARADTAIAVDFNVSVPRLRKPSLVTGTGFDVRIGKALSLGGMQLTAEVGGGYASLGSTVARVIGGARFGALTSVAPVLFVHFGYGAIAYEADVGVGPEPGIVHGPAFDAGFALVLRPFSLFNAGVHAIYSGVQVVSDDAKEREAFSRAHWISLGGHASLYF